MTDVVLRISQLVDCGTGKATIPVMSTAAKGAPEKKVSAPGAVAFTLQCTEAALSPVSISGAVLVATAIGSTPVILLWDTAASSAPASAAAAITAGGHILCATPGGYERPFAIDTSKPKCWVLDYA